MNTTVAGLLQVAALVVILAVAYVPLGDYMARVYTGEKDLLVERVLYRMARVDPRRQQTWVGYALAVLAFSLISFLVVYLLQRLQGVLPWSDGKSGVAPSMAFNTAISFVSNTNWQSFSPEVVMLTKEIAVLNAIEGDTPGLSSDHGRTPWNRCSR